MQFEIISPKHGKFIVYHDDEDYQLISGYTWSISKSKVSFCANSRIKGTDKHISMQRLVLGINNSNNGIIKHIDGDTLNNTKSNLTYNAADEFIQHDGYIEIIVSSKSIGAHSIFIDDCDKEGVLKRKWHIVKQRERYYAYATPCSCSNKKVSMHRLIMKFPENTNIDHKDLNGLNNRRQNLRLATTSQNNANKPPQKNNSSGYKGVYFDKVANYYQSYLYIHKKKIHGGRFKTAKEAANRYNEMALKHYGEFALLNKIPNE